MAAEDEDPLALLRYLQSRGGLPAPALKDSELCRRPESNQDEKDALIKYMSQRGISFHDHPVAHAIPVPDSDIVDRQSAVEAIDSMWSGIERFDGRKSLVQCAREVKSYACLNQ